MKADPLLVECARVARRVLGPRASQADVLWRATVSYLFATGLLSAGNVSTSLH